MADEASGWGTAVGGAISAAGGVVATLLTRYLPYLKESKRAAKQSRADDREDADRDDRRSNDAIKHLNAIIRQVREQIARQGAAIEQGQKVMAALQRLLAGCQARHAG